MSDAKDKLLATFRLFDVNSDGVISAHELHNVLQKLGLDLESIDSIAALKPGKLGGIDYEAFVEWLCPSSLPAASTEFADPDDRDWKKMDQNVLRRLINTSNPLAHIRDIHSLPFPQMDDLFGSGMPSHCGGHPQADASDEQSWKTVCMALVHREDGITKTSLRKERTKSRHKAVMTGITVKEEERVAVQQVVNEDDINWSFVRTGDGHEGWVQSSHLLYEASRVHNISFNAFDVDGDGIISLQDLKAWLKNNREVPYAYEKSSAEELMSEMDCNNDGKVSRWEFSKYGAGYGFQATLASSMEGQIFKMRDPVMVWHTYVGDKKSFYEGQKIPESRIGGVPGIWVGPGRVTCVNPLQVKLFGGLETQSFEEVRYFDQRCCAEGPGALKPFDPELVKERFESEDPDYCKAYDADYFPKGLNYGDYYDNHCATCGVPDVVFESGGTEPSSFSCQKCGYNWSDGPGCCFHGDCMVETESGMVSVKDIRAGCPVRTPDGPAALICVVRTACPHGELEFADCGNGLCLTPAHPILGPSGSWQPARAVGKLSTMPCDFVFNFVLSHGHILHVNGVQCVTLGHGFKEPALLHPYFGTTRILEDLRLKPGWQDGLVDFDGRCQAHCRCSEKSRHRGQLQQVACLKRELKQGSSLFTAELLLRLHASAMEDSGVPLGFRKVSTRIVCEKHSLPDALVVPGLVEHFSKQSIVLISAGILDPWTLGAYCLWWANSVHPFLDGNGRVARALCIIAMSLAAKQPSAWEGVTAEALHEPFRSSFRHQYLQGLQFANETCGFCSCCRDNARQSIPVAVAPLAGLLREIFPSNC